MQQMLSAIQVLNKKPDGGFVSGFTINCLEIGGNPGTPKNCLFVLPIFYVFSRKVTNKHLDHSNMSILQNKRGVIKVPGK